MQGMLGRNPGLEELYNRNRGIGIASQPAPPQPPAPAGPSGLFSTGGAYGQPSPLERTPVNRELAAAQANGFNAPPTPLGGYAGSAVGFAQRMGQENPNNLFGGTLPVRGADGKVAFADGPMRDFGMQSSGKFFMPGDPEGKPGMRKGGYSTLDFQAMSDAKKLFDARRGGPEQRRKDYEARQAGEAKERSAGVLAAAQARGANRADAVRLKRGQLSFDERLAMQDPQAAAQRKVGEGQVASSKELGLARIAAQKEAIAAQEREGKANRENRKEIASLGLAKQGIDPETGKQADQRTTAEKIKDAPDPADLRGRPGAEQKELVKDLPPATQERILREANKPSLFERIGDVLILGDLMGGLAADEISAYLNPFGDVAGLLGVRQRSPVGLSPGAKKVLEQEEARKKANKK